jgi:hypothetical protein
VGLQSDVRLNEDFETVRKCVFHEIRFWGVESGHGQNGLNCIPPNIHVLEV